jgi:hypothetical protein
VPFDTYAAETNTLWETLDENPAEDVVRMVERNPFGPVARNYIDERYNFVPFDHDTVVLELGKPIGEEGSIGIRLGSGGTPFPIECTISRTAFENLVQIGINSEDLEKIGDLEKVKEYLKDWSEVLPGFSSSGAAADDRDSDFWIDVAQVAPLPDCFGSRLSWYNVVSPSGYRDYFKREDLLATPALKVEELTDGAITILSYEHPLEFATKENTKRIIEITNYLNQVRLD